MQCDSLHSLEWGIDARSYVLGTTALVEREGNTLNKGYIVRKLQERGVVSPPVGGASQFHSR